MSSYTFPLDTLFDPLPSSDFCLSQFFESSHSSEVPQFDQIGAKHEDEEMHSQLSFQKMFESYEYGGEDLADIVMGSNCSRGHEDYVCHNSSLEPAFEGPIMHQNGCKSVLRRACSTGDLLVFEPEHVMQTQKSFSDGLRPELEELDSHIMRRYTAERRRMSIDKYRAKRRLRNFSKTIKYECRKTLADNRPRTRGRFKRNEDTCEAPKSSEEEVICMERFDAVSCEESVIYRGHTRNVNRWRQF